MYHIVMRLIIAFYFLLYPLHESYSCKPGPAQNSNRLSFNITWDTSSFPNGLKIERLEAKSNNYVFYNSSQQKMFIQYSWDKKRKELLEIKNEVSVHIDDLFPADTIHDDIRLRFPTKTKNTQKSPKIFRVPKQKKYAITIYVKRKNLKPIRVPAVIKYRKNPSYDPNALKKWSNPCSRRDKLRKRRNK